MIVKQLQENQQQDQTIYQVFTEKEVTTVTDEVVMIPELVWQGRKIDLDSVMNNIDVQIESLNTQKAMYEGYKTQIESL